MPLESKTPPPPSSDFTLSHSHLQHTHFSPPGWENVPRSIRGRKRSRYTLATPSLSPRPPSKFQSWTCLDFQENPRLKKLQTPLIFSSLRLPKKSPQRKPG